MVTHVKTAWKKFRELLPVLTSRHLSSTRPVAMYTALACGAPCYMPVKLGLTDQDGPAGQ